MYSIPTVLWAFLAQTPRDGKGVTCAAAAADIAAYLLQTGLRPPSGDTGDYCRARAKLKLTVLLRQGRFHSCVLGGRRLFAAVRCAGHNPVGACRYEGSIAAVRTGEAD